MRLRNALIAAFMLTTPALGATLSDILAEISGQLPSGSQITAAQLRGVLNDMATYSSNPALGPLPITAYGAVSNQDASAALQAALTDCGVLGRPVYVPSGNWIITSTSSFPTANNNCPGVIGDGHSSHLVLNRFNGPVISAVVQSGIAQTNKTISGLAVSAQWDASPTYDQARLINITGASDGWAYGKFSNLRGFAVHDIVRIATTSVLTGGFIQSNSGFNYFEDFFGQGGSQAIVPDSLVNYADSTSTGNVYSNFIGQAVSGFVWVGGGTNTMVGDMVFNGGQVGQGRVLYIAGGSTCPGYGRSININNMQVDASSTEVVKVECGFINNIKMAGTFGGTNAWAGVDSVALSDVHDLGEAHWGAGGHISVSNTGTPGGGTHTSIPLWKVTLGSTFNPGNSSRYTMARIEVSVTGLLSGVGGGGTIAVYDCAAGGVNTDCTNISAMSSRHIQGDGGSPPAGAPTISASTSGNIVSFATTWTDTSASVFDTSIKVDHGASKVQRVFPVNTTGGVIY